MPVVAGLGLLFAASARPAEVGRPPVPSMQFKGKLGRKVTYDTGPHRNVGGCFPIRVVWLLSSGAEVSELDFGGNESLVEQARKLEGRDVVVRGWISRNGTIHVRSLSADEPQWELVPARFDLGKLIGLDVGKAAEVARAHGHSLRVTMRDGVAQLITMDYRWNRVSVAIENGKVVRASIG